MSWTMGPLHHVTLRHSSPGFRPDLHGCRKAGLAQGWSRASVGAKSFAPRLLRDESWRTSNLSPLAIATTTKACKKDKLLSLWTYFNFPLHDGAAVCWLRRVLCTATSLPSGWPIASWLKCTALHRTATSIGGQRGWMRARLRGKWADIGGRLAQNCRDGLAGLHWTVWGSLHSNKS